MFDKVRLSVNYYYEQGVNIGSEGYIIEKYEGNVYEVEFSDECGATIALIAIPEKELDIVSIKK